MRGGARAAGPAVPALPGEAHVSVRGVLPQQARLRVHRVGARLLLPGAARQARTEAAGALRLHYHSTTPPHHHTTHADTRTQLNHKCCLKSLEQARTQIVELLKLTSLIKIFEYKGTAYFSRNFLLLM